MKVSVIDALKWDVANCEALGYRRMLAKELAELLKTTPEEAMRVSFEAHPDLCGAKMARAADEARKSKGPDGKSKKHWQDDD